MRVFNSLQIVVIYAVMPFILGWLKTNPFPYSTPLFYIGAVAYLAGFIWLTFLVHEGLGESS